jgi:hypothetical protein
MAATRCLRSCLVLDTPPPLLLDIIHLSGSATLASISLNNGFSLDIPIYVSILLHIWTIPTCTTISTIRKMSIIGYSGSLSVAVMGAE